jgi:hypothetical protein
MTKSVLIGLAAMVVVIGVEAHEANAGLPECGNIRLNAVKQCEIRATVQCMAGCSELGIYKTACATKLHRVCRNDCTVNADATCTDSCTVRCNQDCAAGINVICSHNCFGECVGSCDATCQGSADPVQCRATCEATCDGECDIKCAPVVNASCYQHCVECCGGSCTAQANMTCQETCQDKTFEDCEHEFRVNCDASCSGDGALFCDGKYIMSGKDLPGCIKALANQGVTVQGMATGTINLGGGDSSIGCAMAGRQSSGDFGWLISILTVTWALRRRLKKS